MSQKNTKEESDRNDSKGKRDMVNTEVTSPKSEVLITVGGEEERDKQLQSYTGVSWDQPKRLVKW